MTVLDNTTAPAHTPTTADVAGVDPVQFATRLIVDALQEATADYWDRRATLLEQARPRPGDRTGPNSESIDRRCADAAQACRNHANLLRGRL